MNKKHCVGCRNNFYNGNNDIGVSECWHLADAKLVRRKRVPVTLRPPWEMAPVTVPNCYQQKGYVFVAPSVMR